jgi:hypothetical protein
VTALLESSERGQTVLPAVNMAMAETARVEELVADYNRRLKVRLCTGCVRLCIDARLGS